MLLTCVEQDGRCFSDLIRYLDFESWEWINPLLGDPYPLQEPQLSQFGLFEFLIIESGYRLLHRYQKKRYYIYQLRFD